MLTQINVCIQAVFQIYIFMISSFAYVTPFPTKLYEIWQEIEQKTPPHNAFKVNKQCFLVHLIHFKETLPIMLSVLSSLCKNVVF